MPTNSDLALHLFLALAIILALCQLLGRALGAVRQPRVVGEMLAGVLLGPSFLGLIAPGWQHWLFPQAIHIAAGASSKAISHPSLAILYVVGQLGLVLYMFLVGLEFDAQFFRRNLGQAGPISVASIAVPLGAGAVVGYLLGTDRVFFPASIEPWQAALFLGSATAVTAFPVLARIIDDLRIGHLRLGILAIGAAATCDAAAWCLLAILIASVNHSAGAAALTIGGGASYAIVMLLIGRPLFRRLERGVIRRNGTSVEALAGVVALLMLCAWYTDAVGIYAVYGAFVLGISMPRGLIAAGTRSLLEPIVVTLLLPIYFVYSGLNTQATLITGNVLPIACLILATAVLAKGGATLVASRLTGFSWRDSASLGALMNARGLMELVLINIGLQKGMITPTLFTVLVLVTLVTTLGAAPLFQLFYRAPQTEQTRYQVEAGAVR
jgi:Kef-type K+ transport system membrane component KefB